MAHKNIPTRQDIDFLASVSTPGSVSIYTPAGPLSSDGERARIELKNQLRDVITQLEASNAPKQTVNGIKEKVESLLNNTMFWQYQSNSLAIFVNDDTFETYRLPNKLTATVDVADRFYIKPLVRTITFSQSAYVLALAGNSVRLISVTPDQPAEVLDAEGLPTSLDSHLNLDLGGKGTYGRTNENPEVRAMQYTSAVNKAVLPIVRRSNLPLILAAAEPLGSAYRRTNAYKRLLDQSITGNPENESPEALADKARPILDEVYKDELAKVADNFQAKAAQGLGSTNIEVAAQAALMGAIDTLMVDMDQRIPGFIDEETGYVRTSVEDNAENYGVGDEILRRALTSGARVYAIRAEDMPDGAAIAATFRFAVEQGS